VIDREVRVIGLREVVWFEVGPRRNSDGPIEGAFIKKFITEGWESGGTRTEDYIGAGIVGFPEAW